MLFGIAFEFGLCIVLCYAEPFQKVFGTDALSFMHWCLPLPWFWYGQHGTQPQPQRAAASPAQSQRSAAQRSSPPISIRNGGWRWPVHICASVLPLTLVSVPSCCAVLSLRPLVVFSVIVLYDEMRKYITRNYPDSKFTQLTIY